MADNRYLLGTIFRHIGDQLCDSSSELHKQFILSNDQLEACIRLLKVLSSPQTHMLTVDDLAFRYGKVNKTIRNWYRDGHLQGSRVDFNGRLYWMSHDMNKVDGYLISKGFVKPGDIREIDYRMRDMLSKFF